MVGSSNVQISQPANKRGSESDVSQSGSRSGTNELSIPLRVHDDASLDATKRIVQSPLVPMTKKPAPTVHRAGMRDANQVFFMPRVEDPEVMYDLKQPLLATKLTQFP
ncbi:MAG: hypothetical protein ACREM6_06240 [Vulcanimicrobiaceae bacterium]